MLLVGMSANASQRDQEDPYQYGMHFFAAKPVDLDFLSIILSAKSKCQSLPKAVQEITVNRARARASPYDTVAGDDAPCTSGSSSVFIQRKKDRLKKASKVSSPYTRPSSSSPTRNISSNGSGHVTKLTTTDVNISLSSTIAAAAANKNNLQKPFQTTPSPASSSGTFFSQFRRNLFSHFFSDLTSRDSKITPCLDLGTAAATAIADVNAVITEI